MPAEMEEDWGGRLVREGAKPQKKMGHPKAGVPKKLYVLFYSSSSSSSTSTDSIEFDMPNAFGMMLPVLGLNLAKEKKIVTLEDQSLIKDASLYAVTFTLALALTFADEPTSKPFTSPEICMLAEEELDCITKALSAIHKPVTMKKCFHSSGSILDTAFK